MGYTYNIEDFKGPAERKTDPGFVKRSDLCENSGQRQWFYLWTKFCHHSMVSQERRQQ